MKLSKLYCNKPKTFEPIFFNEGFNVIYGDVKNPKNIEVDTHNLGKTTLVKILDFMFLVERDKKQFFFKHYDVFNEFVFFLEIKIRKFEYLTIRRGVANNSKISFMVHTEKFLDLSSSTLEQWKHSNVSIGKAKSLLESWLNFDISYNYRKIIGYSIRTQDDFNNVFQLNKFKRGKDVDWKPYLADLLGFDGSLAKESYDKRSEINKIKEKIAIVSPSNSNNMSKELSRISNELTIGQGKLKNLQSFVERFNFESIDQEALKQLVDTIDFQISELNMQEYSIRNKISHTENSLNTSAIKFRTENVKKIFEESNVLFPEQITKDFNQLIQFNKSITKERNKYLNNELLELNEQLDYIKESLKTLNKKRSEKIGFLSENELLAKYREASSEVAKQEAEIISLEAQRENIEKIQELSKNKRVLETDLNRIQEKLDVNVNDVNECEENTFSKIRIYFNSIISKVLNKTGTIYVYLNDNGNLEFETNYQDISGKNTSESEGNTYYKLLCIAFDLAVNRAYLNSKYPKFLYIDGVFEGLDNRKKKLLLEVLREYSSLGIQIIITAISSEIVGLTNPEDESIFSDKEIILTLHDNGSDGRLFKMPIW